MCAGYINVHRALKPNELTFGWIYGCTIVCCVYPPNDECVTNIALLKFIFETGAHWIENRKSPFTCESCANIRYRNIFTGCQLIISFMWIGMNTLLYFFAIILFFRLVFILCFPLSCFVLFCSVCLYACVHFSLFFTGFPWQNCKKYLYDRMMLFQLIYRVTDNEWMCKRSELWRYFWDMHCHIQKFPYSYNCGVAAFFVIFFQFNGLFSCATHFTIYMHFLIKSESFATSWRPRILFGIQHPMAHITFVYTLRLRWH